MYRLRRGHDRCSLWLSGDMNGAFTTEVFGIEIVLLAEGGLG
ncbi:hypothetical Protein YC6258_02811 [Gynuella sunshinyii YC6258]|uniref:Uncharacterized protein n=1 Tax=Gynuella sunshinyii YC6258 TaxID=1445510 RepID=A0A0C5VWP0_9GAMM|nr:hypothetical Protein YC6258_02811 [Gynuella sunshinyii YC6258]